MSHQIPRVFLSYSSKDLHEVELFDLELRRRGVPLWRDRANLHAGRPGEQDIQEAAREAAGFVFYLTRNAAESDWVRERERAYALENTRRSQSFGLVPVFREDMKVIIEEMIRNASSGAPPSEYDLGRYTGYVVDPGKVGRGDLRSELCSAAESVLCSLLKTIADHANPGGRLRIGLATRGGPRLAQFPLDLLVDWTADYEPTGRVPDRGFGARASLPALQSLSRSLQRYWPSLSLQLVPQCHLSMALAAGFQFRRNTGTDLEVIEIHSGDAWSGPRRPLPADVSAWSMTAEDLQAGRSSLAVAVGISQPIEGTVRTFLTSTGIDAARLLIFKPVKGTSLTALEGLPADGAHRMAVAVLEAILNVQNQHGRGEVHFFYAGPPALAVLLGQQLSNVGPVQTYEWLDSEKRYTPSFRLVSS